MRVANLSELQNEIETVVMDVVEEDQDVQLQRASSDLLADFESSLQPFLWKTLENGKLKIRRKVRARETDRLVALLEPFQELPQLLDPHLGRLLPVLSDALLAFLGSVTRSPRKPSATPLLLPLSQAICKLLYTFCKIRGEKVIVRFFSAETRHLELLLLAVEEAELFEIPVEADAGLHSVSPKWSWEERYICLLWLSHLLLAPFDLATISSAGTDEVARPDIPGLTWPSDLPGVTLRVVPLAIKYLASAGKERDAAKALLVRVCMRKDMQELGLLDSLVQWALSCLQISGSVPIGSAYYYIGILSFLGGVLISSMSTADMDKYLLKIFRTVQAISEEHSLAFKTVHTSAIARKTVIKVLRTITVLVLRKGDASSRQNEDISTEIVEATIGHLLEALADNDTPVRLAASKALSVITLKLEPEMALQVVEAVLESLNNNVLWENKTGKPNGAKTRDLSAVNPLEWHGLILTLSHLLYRRSPPPESLGDILHALLIGLTFERRSTSGSSVGTNVRDAACFGIWALARRYTTNELQKVAVSSVFAAKLHDASSSIIQVLGTELVVSASLDSAGNIRRGASAALQELIGRHPDIVAEGIAVVQVVDYHAVALRSRAVLEVAPAASLLSDFYEDALLDALMGWRGIGDGDASSRRIAATGMGTLARAFKDRGEHRSWHRIADLVRRIEIHLSLLRTREIDERHGLLLSMAGVVASLSEVLNGETIKNSVFDAVGMMITIGSVLQPVLAVLLDAKAVKYRRPDAIAEAVSRLIAADCPIIRIARVLKAISETTINMDDEKFQESWTQLYPLLSHPTKPTGPIGIETKSLLDSLEQTPPSSSATLQSIISAAEELTSLWLRFKEPEVIDAATEAAANLMFVLTGEERSDLIAKWIAEAAADSSNRSRQIVGYLFALATVFPVASEKRQDEICKLLKSKFKSAWDVENKVAVLLCLGRGTILTSHTADFVDMIAQGLDDYTTDARGDIGSLVRIEALKAAGKAFQSVPWELLDGKFADQYEDAWFKKSDVFGLLYGKVLRLSAEKLDKVRTEAQKSLAIVVQDKLQRERFEHSLISSKEYFRWLLDLQLNDYLSLSLFQYDTNQWSIELFEGFVSSADTGSEGLISASRAALVEFCEQGALDDSQDYSISSKGNPAIDFVCDSLLQVMRKHITNDRFLVPTMEVLSFLFDAAIIQRSKISFKSLYILTQKAHYKTGNVRKLEAAIKLYGGLLGVYPEAVQKLSSMLLHPFPNIRNQVADTLWVDKGVGKGVNWVKAKKDDLKILLEELERK